MESYRRDESLALPEDIDYATLPGLSNEARHKLQTQRPRTIGQAGRIDGMTPAALTLLVAHLRRRASNAKAFTREALTPRPQARPRRGMSGRRAACRWIASGRWRSRLFHVKQSSVCDRFVDCCSMAAADESDRAVDLPICGPGIWRTRCNSWRWRRRLGLGRFRLGGRVSGLGHRLRARGTDGARVHLIESNGKKAAFLREAVRVTGAPAQIHTAGDRISSKTPRARLTSSPPERLLPFRNS